MKYRVTNISTVSQKNTKKRNIAWNIVDFLRDHGLSKTHVILYYVHLILSPDSPDMNSSL